MGIGGGIEAVDKAVATVRVAIAIALIAKGDHIIGATAIAISIGAIIAILSRPIN